MGVLGLDGKEYREDNIVTRLFWPSDSPIEADTLARQGFWVCVLVGLASALFAVFGGSPLAGAILLLFYWLGGIGVREHSTAAAIMVSAMYVASAVAGVLSGRLPGILDVILAGLLLANIRGTIISARWEAKGEEMPTRFDDSLLDKIQNKLPAMVWPIGRYVLLVLTALLAVLVTLGILAVRQQRSQQHMQVLQDSSR